jgi:hypothetical protein
MKIALSYAAMLVVMCAAPVNAAEEKKDVKPAAELAEFAGTTGCAKCKFGKESGATACTASIKVGEKVYILKGEALTREMPGCCGKDGEYIVKGKIVEDGKAIEVSEIKKKP